MIALFVDSNHIAPSQGTPFFSFLCVAILFFNPYYSLVIMKLDRNFDSIPGNDSQYKND